MGKSTSEAEVVSGFYLAFDWKRGLYRRIIECYDCGVE